MPGDETARRGSKPAMRSTWYTTTASLAASRNGPAFSIRDPGTDAAPLPATGGPREFEVASEAIAVIDIIQSTVSTNLYGWHSVGRVVARDLRRLAQEACAPLGLASAKSTGDGLLLTFSDSESAATAVPSALAAMRSLLAKLEVRNADVPQQHRLDVRVALHFGEVDVTQGSREGPNVAFAFRMEGVTEASLATALNPIDPRAFPSANYVICSEAVADVLDWVGEASPRTSCGLFKMKGFLGWWEVFLLEPALDAKALPKPSADV